MKVLDTDARRRYLVLLAAFADRDRRHAPPTYTRYLCGFDEREHFIAEIPDGVTSVRDALAALRPIEVNRAEADGLKVLRQGEWFFIPAPDFVPSRNHMIHRREPLGRATGSRLMGNPHVADELIRLSSGQVEVETGRKLPNGRPETRVMTVPAGVYIRGKVRHRDHRTRVFWFWHRVVMNRELSGGRRMTFVD